MGNWNIHIQGIGCHHNINNPTDANVMAKAFAEALVQAGHSVEAATFTSGSKEDLLPSPAARDVELATLNNEVHRLRANLAARNAEVPDNIVPVDFTPPEFSA